MINLKGYRKVIIDGIEIRYKCISHEATNVYHEASNNFWKVDADNSGQLNKMSIPSVIIPLIKECYVFIDIKKAKIYNVNPKNSTQCGKGKTLHLTPSGFAND